MKNNFPATDLKKTVMITTSLKKNKEDVELALEIASRHDLLYYDRSNLSAERFTAVHQCNFFLVVKQKQLSAISQNSQEFFFHPGTGLIRAKNIDKKREDLLVKALGIDPGDHVLDCTAGLANDAVVVAHYLKEGQVTALEKNSIVFLITSYGLALYLEGSASFRESFSRIQMIHTDYAAFLACALDKGQQYDSIYFDPMFTKPLQASTGIYHLRDYAEYDALSETTIEKAMEVCRKRVVVKIRNTDSAFISRYHPDEVLGSSKAKTKYAVFKK